MYSLYIPNAQYINSSLPRYDGFLLDKDDPKNMNWWTFYNIIKQFASIVIVFQLSVTKGSEIITTKFRLHSKKSISFSAVLNQTLRESIKK